MQGTSNSLGGPKDPNGNNSIGHSVHCEETMAMKILFAAAEMTPFAKVGGLADVVGALPLALSELGEDVRVVIPDYAMIRKSGKYKAKLIAKEMPLTINSHWVKPMTVWEIEEFEVPIYLIGTDEWFQDADKSETIYRVGIDQYLFFSKAVLELEKFIDWKPDIIHCHDWQTGFIPVLMREKYHETYSGSASFFTIHNLAYQGEFDTDILAKLDLPYSLFNSHQVEAWGRVNFLKSGSAYSDFVTTVSETYAEEIQTSTYGCALDGLMQHLHNKGRLEGILNGIDMNLFNPSTDKDITVPYSANDLAGKAICKKELFKELKWKGSSDRPLFGMISRISGQKGHRLLIESADQMSQLGAQIVILGSGEPPLVEALHQLTKSMPETFHFVEGFHENLAPKIYAGCDGFLMPSVFEPCGLGQMISMRYGTVPIVRATGGLADTVFEGKNGFVFHESNQEDFMDATHRFVELYKNKSEFRNVQLQGMQQDFSWEKSAKKYNEAYRLALHVRRAVSISA